MDLHFNSLSFFPNFADFLYAYTHRLSHWVKAIYTV